MRTNPLVSVIVPVYNDEQHIKGTLLSILNQTFKNFEIIVIDDCSDDSTGNILSSFGDRIKLIKQINSGPAIARNRGIFESAGSYLAFCDSDDLWEPTKLERQMAIFDTNPDCGLVATNGTFVDEDGILTSKYIADPQFLHGSLCRITIKDMLSWARLYPSATVIRKDSIIEAGLLFDGKTYLFENVLLWLRIIEKHGAFFINEMLVKRRYLKTSLSHKFTKKDRYAQAKVYALALIDFPEYHKDIRRKLIHSLYSVARLESKDKNFAKAKSLLLEILRKDFFFGRQYFNKQDSFLKKTKKILAPLGLLGALIFNINVIQDEW